MSEKGESFILDQAELSGEDGDSSEEEGGQELDQYEKDGFVVDEEEQAEPAAEGGEKKRRKKKRKKIDATLDKEDLDLLEENTGRKVPRPARPEEKQYKRLKKGGARDASNTQSRVLKNLNFDGEDDAAADAAGEDLSKSAYDDSVDLDNIDDDDDLDDFIVDINNNPIKRNKRKSGPPKRGATYTQQQLDAASDIFGPMDGRPRQARPRDEFDEDFDENMDDVDPAQLIEKPVSLQEQYEPSMLENKYLTKQDQEIRQIDIPERLQLRHGSKFDEKTVNDEAEWIHKHVFQRDSRTQERGIYVPKIAAVIEFIQKQHFEVPFIFAYRKDYYEPMTMSDLWEIYDWDEKWAHLQARQDKLRNMCVQADRLDQYEELLKEAQTEEEVSDLYDNFQMRYGSDLVKAAEAQGSSSSSQRRPKRAVKRDLYVTYKTAGFGDFLKYFGITAKQYGENLYSNYEEHPQIDPSEDPYTIASKFTSSAYPEPEAVLRAARYMMAQEVAYDFHVRQSVRIIFQKVCDVWTTATPKGKKEIDAFHPFMIVKDIHKKPATHFDDEQFLLILKAESEGMLKLRIEAQEAQFLNDMQGLYFSSGTSAVAKAWNSQRKDILQDALKLFLFPLFEKEMRVKLTEEAVVRVTFQSARKLESQLLVAPWQPTVDDDDADAEEDVQAGPIRIMACCYGGQSEPTMCVVMDKEGEVINHIKLSFLSDRGFGKASANISNVPTGGRDREADLDKLENFVISYQPRAIVVAATELDAFKLHKDIKELVHGLRRDRRLKMFTQVSYADPEVARAFKLSSRAAAEFPEYPTILRQAISIGRRLLDPLSELAGLCDEANGILCLRLHDLQSMVPADILVKHLHRCFINVVNAVGVDINRMLVHKFTSSTLQFVSGLGPRKAELLLHNVFRRGGKISTREAVEELLLPCVCNNCVGFIRISEQYSINVDDTNPLDETRIHPKDYRFARKIAGDALDREGDDEQLQECIPDIMKRPKRLDDIDLDAFADMLQKNGEGFKKMVLYDIKKELTHPFADIRNPFVEPTVEEVFVWLTGETTQTLQPGIIVTARAFKAQDSFVAVKLDNGLVGFIYSKNISDDPFHQNPNEIPVGMTVHCRVQAIDYEKFTVRLTCKGSDLESNTLPEVEQYNKLKNKNPYLHITPKDVEPAHKEPPKPQQVRKLVRVIHHPLFQNMDHLAAEQFLASKPVGEMMFRPSSRGPDHLTLTWKFFDNVYIHMDVLEGDKPNAVSLGRTFTVNNEKYNDLDEIQARYIEPMNTYIADMTMFRYFKPYSSQMELEQMLHQEKMNNAQRIPYMIGVSHQQPGKFVLSYLPSTRIRNEFVSVVPEGFRFRKQSFKDPEQLIQWFKKHFRDVPNSGNRNGDQKLQAQMPKLSINQDAAPPSWDARQAPNQFAQPAPVQGWGSWQEPPGMQQRGAWPQHVAQIPNAWNPHHGGGGFDNNNFQQQQPRRDFMDDRRGGAPDRNRGPPQDRFERRDDRRDSFERRDNRAPDFNRGGGDRRGDMGRSNPNFERRGGDSRPQQDTRRQPPPAKAASSPWESSSGGGSIWGSWDQPSPATGSNKTTSNTTTNNWSAPASDSGWD